MRTEGRAKKKRRAPSKVYFSDVPQFTRHAGYKVDVSWQMLDEYMKHAGEAVDGGLDLEPDFQRAHVWTEAQQVRYVEYILRGGMSGRDLYFNCAGWNQTSERQGPYVIVDGKQRLRAVLRFMHGEIPAFGHRLSDYGDKPDFIGARFHWHVNDLGTREEILQWYLDLNRGGTVHTDEEIAKVEALLAAERAAK